MLSFNYMTLQKSVIFASLAQALGFSPLCVQILFIPHGCGTGHGTSEGDWSSPYFLSKETTDVKYPFSPVFTFYLRLLVTPTKVIAVLSLSLKCTFSLYF